MAEAKFNKGSEEWMMFTDFWQLCQRFWYIEPDNESYWEELVQAVKDFPMKYGEDKFAVALSLAFVNTQQAKYKQAKGRKE